MAGLLFFPYIFFYIKTRVNEFEEKRRARLEYAFKDGMEAVVASLVAGYSIENAFRESLNELEMIHSKKSDIYGFFSKMVNRISLNENIEDVFEDFARESKVDEIKRFSQVLSYAKKSGGNLVMIIKNTTECIIEKVELKREINTIISAKKLEQKIMNLVPAGIIMYMRFTSGEMFNKLYNNAFGVAVMSVCLGIYGIAIMLARKITDIKV